jgi:hypothetical protein
LNDESHFVRDFKSTYGFSPAHYRSQFQNQPANGNGNGHGPTKGSGRIRQHLVQIAKHSVLPSLQVFLYVFSSLS